MFRSFGTPPLSPLNRLLHPTNSIRFDPETPPTGGTGAASTDDDTLKKLLDGIENLKLPNGVIEALTKNAKDEGGWQAYAMSLADQLQKVREKVRDITQAPKGAMIITDQKEIDAVNWLKSNATDLPTAVETFKTGQTAVTKLAETEREASVKTAVGEEWNAEVLKQMPGFDKLSFDTITIPANGDTPAVTQRNVKFTNAAGAVETMTLDAYADAHWKTFIPVLKVTPAEGDAAGGAGGTGTAVADQGTKTARTVPAQGAGGNGGTKGPTGGFDFVAGVLDAADAAAMQFVPGAPPATVAK